MPGYGGFEKLVSMPINAVGAMQRGAKDFGQATGLLDNQVERYATRCSRYCYTNT